jgi:hypothetical protein
MSPQKSAIPQESAATEPAPPGFHDLDDLIGSWEEDPGFDSAMAEFSKTPSTSNDDILLPSTKRQSAMDAFNEISRP